MSPASAARLLGNYRYGLCRVIKASGLGGCGSVLTHRTSGLRSGCARLRRGCGGARWSWVIRRVVNKRRCHLCAPRMGNARAVLTGARRAASDLRRRRALCVK
ncbi:hypothetical protein EVAR_16680_1 [Eumeta japonica]|uniref:Uncharacterized protein n=1 Tax=Eumeta variegata TaxID=151549 RepID=A0A4C1V6J3_EUMVA|nr:hypothetical protein EVAR_16680_1 [Eumeta japonica]